MPPLPEYTASVRRKWLPKRGHFVHVHDRHAMKRGHPTRSFSLSLPVPQLPIDWAGKLSFPMDGNDQYGICLYAAGCHGDNTFTGNVGQESVFDLQTIIKDYLALSGGDNGLSEDQLLQEWKGGLAGVKEAVIYDALDIDPTNVSLMQTAIALFGGVVFMLDVPDAWIREFDTGVLWDVPARADQNNGHGTWINGIQQNGNYKVQTWGSYCFVTPAGVKVCDPSAFVVFSPRWFNAQGIAPNGLTYDQLAAYWVQAGGKPLPPNPFVQNPPAPVPAPPPPSPVPQPPSPPMNIEQFVQQLVDQLFANLEAKYQNRPLVTLVLKELDSVVDAELQALLNPPAPAGK